MKILQSSWLVALVGCLLYLGTTAALLKPEQFQGALAAKKNAHVKITAEDDPSWRFRNPEFDQWLSELKREKDAVALRETQLKELELRVAAERQELAAITQAVFQVQSEFDRNVIHFREQEVENVKKQVKVLAAMPATGAAMMLRELPDEQIVKILFTMKADLSGGILDAMSRIGQIEAKRAAVITERMRNLMPGATTASTHNPPPP